MNTLFFLRSSTANEHKTRQRLRLVRSKSASCVCNTELAPIYILRQNHNLEFLFTLKLQAVASYTHSRLLIKTSAFILGLNFVSVVTDCQLGTLENFLALLACVSAHTFMHSALTPTFQAKQKEEGDLASEIRNLWWENPGKNKESGRHFQKLGLSQIIIIWDRRTNFNIQGVPKSVAQSSCLSFEYVHSQHC